MKTARISDIESARSDPQSAAQQRLGRHGNPYPKGDRATRTTLRGNLAEIARSSSTTCARFHRGFYGASNAVVVGGRRLRRPTLERRNSQKGLGDWTSRPPTRGFPKPRRRSAGDVPHRRQGQAERGRRRPLEVGCARTIREFQALRLAAQIFGGWGGGSGRLWDRFAKGGLSYGVGATCAAASSTPTPTGALSRSPRRRTSARAKGAFDDEMARALATASPPPS